MTKEPEVDKHGKCSKCGGKHYGTGNICIYNPKSPWYRPDPDYPTELSADLLEGDHPRGLNRELDKK